MISRDNTTHLKAFAIIIVMVGHLITVNKTPFPNELRWIASFGVTIFLILSGYGLMKSFEKNGLSGFFKKRILTVLIPFYVMSTITFFVDGPSEKSFTDLLNTFTFTNLEMSIDGTMWYIYFISIWYVLFYFAARLIKSKIIICITLFALASIFIYNNPFIGHENLRFQTTLHAYSFPIGILLSLVRLPLIIRKISGPLLLIACFFIQKSQWEAYADYKFSLSCIAFGLGIVFILSCYEMKSSLLTFIGLVSYEAYLVEGLNLRYQFSGTWYLDCIMFFIVTISLAVTLQKCIEILLLRKKGREAKSHTEGHAS